MMSEDYNPEAGPREDNIAAEIPDTKNRTIGGIRFKVDNPGIAGHVLRRKIPWTDWYTESKDGNGKHYIRRTSKEAFLAALKGNVSEGDFTFWLHLIPVNQNFLKVMMSRKKEVNIPNDPIGELYKSKL